MGRKQGIACKSADSNNTKNTNTNYKIQENCFLYSLFFEVRLPDFHHVKEESPQPSINEKIEEEVILPSPVQVPLVSGDAVEQDDDDEWDGWARALEESFCAESASQSDDELLNDWEIDDLSLGDQWEDSQDTKAVNYRRKAFRFKKPKLRKMRVNATRYNKELANRARIAEHFEHQKSNSTFKPTIPTTTSPSPPVKSKFVAEDWGSRSRVTVPASSPWAASSWAASSSRSASAAVPPGFSQALINDLQNRELTPEDYELLLRLDESVAKKTLSASQVAKFQTKLVDEELKRVYDCCMICLNEFDCGETTSVLPCGHLFHSGCITNWLTTSSINCPIDNLPLQ